MKISIHICTNKTLSGYYGQIKILKNKKDCAIAFNKETIFNSDMLDEVIKHEFCHAWAWLKKRNTTHGKYWKELMRVV